MREALCRRDEAAVSQMTSAGAAALLLRPTAEEHVEFAADYRTLGVAAQQQEHDEPIDYTTSSTVSN